MHFNMSACSLIHFKSTLWHIVQFTWLHCATRACNSIFNLHCYSRHCKSVQHALMKSELHRAICFSTYHLVYKINLSIVLTYFDKSHAKAVDFLVIFKCEHSVSIKTNDKRYSDRYCKDWRDKKSRCKVFVIKNIHHKKSFNLSTTVLPGQEI